MAATVPGPGRGLTAILLGIALAALLLPTLVVLTAPHLHPRQRLVIAIPPRVVPQAELPPVEPVQFANLLPDDARAYNATVPFVTGPNPAARPFTLQDGAVDVARATDCLAAAVLYEAGDDAVGEKAVAQVVLNRLRHPAFPKTVCGVVFQGSERSTGCQFTFTCDGALARVPGEAAWTRARAIAAAALTGAVYKPVGYATHYHTDWVVPYWQASLDKIAAVHTHLFFRWTGWWGTPPAFNRQVQPGEPVIAKLAGLSAAHRGGLTLEGLTDAPAMADNPEAAGVPGGGDSNDFLVAFPPGTTADAMPALAAAACGPRDYCRYLAWSDRGKTPTGLPLTPAQSGSMTFSYLRDRVFGYEKTLWNCAQVKRADPAQCMKSTAAAAASPTLTVTPPAPLPAGAPAELGGVRRRGADKPAGGDAGAGFDLGKLPTVRPTLPSAPAATPPARAPAVRRAPPPATP